MFWEGVPDDFGLPDCLPVALTAGAGNQQAGASKIDGTPERRAIAVVDANAVERYDFTAIEDWPSTHRSRNATADGATLGLARPDRAD